MSVSSLTAVLLSVSATTALAKVFEVYDRTHFHDLLQDASAGLRSATFVAFYREDEQCTTDLNALNFDSDGFPAVDNVMFARYELTTLKQRIWHKLEDSMDLAEMIGLNSYIESKQSCGCPVIAYVPASYANEIGEWYLNEASIDKVKFWDATDSDSGDWRRWAWTQLQTTVEIIQPQPFDFEVTVTPNSKRLEFTDAWIESRTFAVDAMESKLEFKAYIGDEFHISKEPEFPSTVLDDLRSKGLRPTVDAPPLKYSVYASDQNNPQRTDNAVSYVLSLIDSGTVGGRTEGWKHWGFSIGRRDEMNARLLKRRHVTTCTSHTRNLLAPSILPKFGKVGYLKMKMPEGLHSRMKSYYQKWYHKREVEGWDMGSTQINVHDFKTYMISLDHDFDERNDIALNVIKPILEEWTNTTDLKFNAFYGIREYATGAVLRNHVDRFSTHVISAIMQIGQTGLEEPWTLEVFDFDGNRVNLELAPGELALYESGALIHGRPKPLNGTSALFTNAFIHFAPNDWVWSITKVYKSAKGKEIFKLLHTTPQNIWR